MISRQEHNELIRKAGRARLKHIQDRYFSSGTKAYGHYGGIHEQISDEKKQQIRKEQKAKLRKLRGWTIIIFSAAALIAGFLCCKILLSLAYI